MRDWSQRLAIDQARGAWYVALLLFGTLASGDPGHPVRLYLGFAAACAVLAFIGLATSWLWLRRHAEPARPR